jgi:hypothetical protein
VCVKLALKCDATYRAATRACSVSFLQLRRLAATLVCQQPQQLVARPKWLWPRFSRVVGNVRWACPPARRADSNGSRAAHSLPDQAGCDDRDRRPQVNSTWATTAPVKLPRHTSSNCLAACAQYGRPRCPNGPFLHDGFSDLASAGHAAGGPSRHVRALCRRRDMFSRERSSTHRWLRSYLGCCHIACYAAWLLSYWTHGCCLQVSNKVDGRPGLR